MRILAAVTALMLVAAPASASIFDALAGVPYRLFRENLLRGGFFPVSHTGVCRNSDTRCERFPEFRFCDSGPLSVCIAEWRSPDGSTLSVATIGKSDPAFYMIDEN